MSRPSQFTATVAVFFYGCVPAQPYAKAVSEGLAILTAIIALLHGI